MEGFHSADEIIQHLELLPHPEGGYYRQTFKSRGSISAEALAEEGYEGPRSYSTAIYFLLTCDSFSAFHRIKQDEIWHHYDGAAINVHVISASGQYSCTRVGKDLRSGEIPQFVVEGGCWFASEVAGRSAGLSADLPEAFSLVGCTVSPGFDFKDFELASREHLSATYPAHAAIIQRLTR